MTVFNKMIGVLLMRGVVPIALLVMLSACSGSQEGSAQVDNPPVTNVPVDDTSSDNGQSDDGQGSSPPVIEDIACEVTYPLVIADVFQQDNQQQSTHSISQLFDADKTNQSSWQADNTESTLIIELESPALLKALVVTFKELSITHGFSVSASKDAEQWELITGPDLSDNSKLIPDLIDLSASAYTAKYLQLSLSGGEDLQSNTLQASELLEVEVFGCAQEVTHNIELIDWYLSVPTDSDFNGRSDSIKETELANGYFDPRFFSLSADGGLIFTTSVSGYRTSENTKYVRAELREMLRRGDTSHSTKGVNKNNWVFSSAPQADRDNAGGVDGRLEVDVAVNHVTSNGEAYQIGRVIIGQIHANDDEPIRVYYRKLPNNDKGAIYFAHEIAGGDESYHEIIGSRSNTADNPADGIALNERFSYAIDVQGDSLTFELTKADGSVFSKTIDISQSGYGNGGQYQYFKAGVYNVNNSADPHDYVRATFYKIDNSHVGYLF